MIREEIIHKLLIRLDNYIAILYSFQKYSFEEFVAKPEYYGSTERFLQVAIETVTDMGKHVIAGLKLGNVEWNSDIPKIFAEYGYIDSPLQTTWSNMIDLSNTLLYHYTDIDQKKVYNTLQHNLNVFDQLRATFAQFL